MQNDLMNSNPNKLSERRTEWAYERTLLANERTFIAWLRTGLAITAGAAIVARLLANANPGWLVDLLAIVLVLAGTAIIVLSTWGYRKIIMSMSNIAPGIIPLWLVWILVAILQISAIMIFVLFLLG